MRKIIFILVLGFLFVSSFKGYLFASGGEWQDIGRGNLDIRAVCFSAENPNIIYIGSKNRVLKSQDRGENWRTSFSINGQNSSINFLYVSPQDKNSIYVASENGLFQSLNQGATWCRVFKGRNRLENECRSLAVSRGNIYLATAGGLFFSQDKGRSWNKIIGLDNKEIFTIASDIREPDYLYLTCSGGVFKSQDAGHNWKKIFFVSQAEESVSQGEPAEEERVAENVIYICIDPNNLNHIYLATPKGIYKSNNRGESWEPLRGLGFIERKVSYLLVSNKGDIYALAPKNIFEYKGDYWQSISFGLEAGELQFLSLDIEGNLYVCAAKGLFKKNKLNFNGQQTQGSISLYFKDEPDIGEVLQAAIRYAEVSPDKIERWRKQASKKAWLPQVSVGLDRETGDLWHWETGSTTKNDDDSLKKGRDYIGWDLTISWDLGELIWNNDQTSIDVRSKLMAELRDDILDNLTKLYFERIRLKIEIDSLTIEDHKKRIEKELRLRELTASIDALTGGYFSNAMKNKVNALKAKDDKKILCNRNR
ncbi:MAG: hypothetical protein V2A59_02660 [Candidatus Omnitrophota bacterium]